MDIHPYSMFSVTQNISYKNHLIGIKTYLHNFAKYHVWLQAIESLAKIQSI